jgi:hypothetical protein
MLLSFDPLPFVIINMTKWEFRIAILTSALRIESIHEVNSLRISDPRPK